MPDIRIVKSLRAIGGKREVIAMAKTKLHHKLTTSEVVAEFERLKFPITAYEQQNLGVIIELVESVLAWRRNKDNQKASARMQLARDKAESTFPDWSRRTDLNQVVLDLARGGGAPCPEEPQP